jgi:hypothetical protein
MEVAGPITLDDCDTIVMQFDIGSNRIDVFKKLIPNIKPALSFRQFLDRFTNYEIKENEHKIVLLETYCRLGTAVIDLKTFVEVLDKLDFTLPAKRYEFYKIIQHKINPLPKWDDLALILKYVNANEFLTFLTYIDMMKEKPTHDYILKILNQITKGMGSYVPNLAKQMIVERLQKRHLFPEIVSISVFLKYVQCLESTHEGTQYMGDTIKLLIKAMKEEQKESTKLVNYHVGESFTIDWSLVGPVKSITQNFKGKRYVCYPDGRIEAKDGVEN